VSAVSDGLNEGMARTLRAIAFGLGNGVALLTAISLFLYYRRTAAIAPTLQSLKSINTMTILSMAASLAAIVVSEIVWKRMLAGAVAADANAKTQAAFVVRAALRQAAALAGTVTFYLACTDGVLRAYPAYWVDLVPAALLWSFLYLHWPSLENLKVEVSAATDPL
jgi:hypothetical protein